MNLEEAKRINALFDRVANVEAQSGPRDADADALITRRMRQSPNAAYYLVQTLIIQQEALKQAEARLSNLERNPRGQSQAEHGFLPNQARQPSGEAARYRQSDWSWGGDFLAGAAQTALGVAGGVLIADAIGGLVGGLFSDAHEVAQDDDLSDAVNYEASATAADNQDAESDESFFGLGDFLFGDDSGDDGWI